MAVLCCCKVVIQHLAPPPPLTLPVRPAGCVDIGAEAAPGDQGGSGLAGRADGHGAPPIAGRTPQVQGGAGPLEAARLLREPRTLGVRRERPVT